MRFLTGILLEIVDLIIGKSSVAFFTSSLQITLSKREEFSAAHGNSFNLLYALRGFEIFYNL